MYFLHMNISCGLEHISVFSGWTLCRHVCRTPRHWKSSPTKLPFYCLKQGLSINPELTNGVSLIWQLAHGDHTTLTSETRVTHGLPNTCTVYGSCEDQNSILHVCQASALTSEPSSQPSYWFLPWLKRCGYYSYE